MQKLINAEVREALDRQGDTSQLTPENIMVVAKFFALGSGATWYLYDWDRDTAGKDGECTEAGFPPRSEDDPPNRLWVFANLGDRDNAECGTVLLQELEALKFGSIPRVERDLHWTPMPLSEVIKTIKNGGHL